MLWVLNLSDGRNSLLDIAEKANLHFDLLENAAGALLQHGLLTQLPEQPSDPAFQLPLSLRLTIFFGRRFLLECLCPPGETDDGDPKKSRSWNRTMTEQSRRFERFKEGVVLRTLEGKIHFWNRASEELYGWGKEDALGRVSHDLLRTQFPKPLEEIESELVKKGRWAGKLVHATRDGGRRVVESWWILDLAAEPPAVVEINAASAESRMNREASTNSLGANRIKEDRAPEQSPGTRRHDYPSTFANVILVGAALVSIFLLFYFIYYYGWTGERVFSSPGLMVPYWVMPGVLASVLFGFLQRSREFRINAALLCVSVAVSVYTVETLLTFYKSLPSSDSVTLWSGHHQRRKQEVLALAQAYGADFDTRSKVSVILQLRQQNVKAMPSISPLRLLKEQPDGTFRSDITVNGSEVLPIGGVSNAFVVFCNETGEYATYHSDQYGFHNPTTIWQSDEMRVAGLGDSFTEGACVASDKNFMALIRQEYRTSLNLGSSGMGPLLMLATIREYLMHVKPRVVLWFFYEENDFFDLLQESNSPLLRNYLKDDFSQNLRDRQPAIDEALIAYLDKEIEREQAQDDTEASIAPSFTGKLKHVLKLGQLRQTLGLVGAYSKRPSEDVEFSDRQLNLFRDVLAQANSEVSRWGGRLHFVYLPSRDRYANGAEYRRETVLAIVKDVGLPIIDIHARFKLERDPLKMFPFRRFGHYNDEGHRSVAEEVLKALHRLPLHPNSATKGVSMDDRSTRDTVDEVSERPLKHGTRQ